MPHPLRSIAERTESEETNVTDKPLTFQQKLQSFLIREYYVPRENIVKELVAGLVVGLAVVPEAIAFALVVGILPQTGINTTMIASIMMGLFGDRPGLCNGASGAIAVVVVDLVRNHGEMYLPYAVLLGGLTCIAFAFLRCANLLVLISSSVMIGFVNGLAIIISLSQVSQFKANLLDGIPGRQADEAATPATPTGRRLHGAIDVFTDGEPWLGWDVAQWMLLEVIVVIVAMVSFPKLAGYDKFTWTKNIPPSLVGILLATAVEWGIVRPAGYETRTVGDIGQMNGGLPKSMWDQPYDLPPLNGETFGIVAPTGFALAGVALIEQLMTQELVDDLTKTGSSKHRESFGLGIGNVVVGLLGGMGGNAMIAHSLIQVRTGGTHRLSNIAVGVTVLIISAAAYPFVNLMPQAAFVGMMWVIVYYTFEWKSLPIVWHAFTGLQRREDKAMLLKIKRIDVLVIVVTTIVTGFTNLAVGVACGLIVNLTSFAWDSVASVRLTAKEDMEGDELDEATGQPRLTRVYEVEGPLFFASARKFKALFNKEEDPDDVELHCLGMQIMDFSALDAIAKVASEYKALGKRFHLRFLRQEDHRVLAKGRDLLRDVESWRVTQVVGESEEDLQSLIERQPHELHVTKPRHSLDKGSPAKPGDSINSSHDPL